MVDGCGKCAKVFLVIYNIFFFLLGLGAIGIGAFALIRTSDLVSMLDTNTDSIDLPGLLKTGAYTLIGVGIFVAFISAIGFIGACKEHKCMLVAYGVIVFILLIVQLVAVVLAAVFKKQIEEKLLSYLNSTLVNYYEGDLDSKDEFSVLWDGYQIKQQCCGLTSQDDYLYTKKWNGSLTSPVSRVPFSCCKFVDSSVYPDHPDNLVKLDENCSTSPNMDNIWMNKGCVSEIDLDLDDVANIVIIFGGVVLAIELVGVILAFCLCRAVHRSGKLV